MTLPMKNVLAYHQAQMINADTADARQFHAAAAETLLVLDDPKLLAGLLVNRCYSTGHVVTITLQPLKPFAMGSHHMVVDFREVRHAN